MEGCLKKQSQFVPGQNGATSYLKGDYDNNPAFRVEENKVKYRPSAGNPKH